MAAKVERAVVNRLVRPDPALAALARIDAQIDAIRRELHDLTWAGREAAHLEEILAHARVRIEEWTA